MYSKKVAALSFSLIGFFSTLTFAAEELMIDFQYQGTHNTDLSTMREAIHIGPFTDGRDVDDKRLITNADIGAGDVGGYLAEAPLADLIQDAMLQGFQHGNAKLTDTTDGLRLEGNLLSAQTQVVDRGGVQSIQITLRTAVQLRNSSRTIWQTTLFGRGIAPVSDGLEAAVSAALDRSIRELVGDDYFLMEL